MLTKIRQLPHLARGLLVTAALLLVAAGARSNATPTATPPLLTEHYRIYSDLDDATTNDLAGELERCWAEYDRRLGALAPERQTKQGRYDVRLFLSESDYKNDGGENAIANSAGMFDSRRRLLSGFLGDRGRGELRRTLRHEAFHQFAYETLGPGLPLWANEGLAQLFEHAVPTDAGLVMGEVPPVPLLIVQRAAREGRLIDFDAMLGMKQRAWSRVMEDRRDGAELYAQAWAMVHFLAYAADANGTPLYRDRLNAFLTDVAAGTPGDPAWRRHFGQNLDGFRKRFETYVLALEPTQAAKEVDRHDVLAGMLAILSDRGMRFSSAAEFRQYVLANGFRLHREHEGIQRASPADPTPLFNDARGRPLDNSRLRFELDVGGDLPALVTRPGDGYVYRTRFYRHAGKTMFETMLSTR